MKRTSKKSILVVMLVTLLVASLIMTGCQQEENSSRPITVVLDWIPNTNHTGLYAALEEGYFEEEGLTVEIIQPTEGGSADLIAAGQGEFGLSYQEQVTYARTAETPLPVKAIAAVIQHNTSGFASPTEKQIVSPRDFEGKKYGGWNSPMEEAMLKGLMEISGADFSKLEMVSVGTLDFFTAVTEHVDFTWIYYGWDGIAAEVKGVSLNFIKLQDVDERLDSYTPVIIANEELLEEDPELARSFMKAVSKGYQLAIEDPDRAVEHLLKHAPEIDREIAIESQRYLAKEYRGDASRWGEMDVEIWQKYADWMFEKQLIPGELIAEEAFTNEYLPE